MVKTKFTVLMADDDEDDCTLVRDAFEGDPYVSNLNFVKNSEELLDYLYGRDKFSSPDRSPRPDIILLDLNMPRKDGREALREIKADPNLCSIPIIVLTTSREESDVLYCYDSLAASYITKPSSFTELVEIMRLISKYWFELAVLPKR